MKNESEKNDTEEKKINLKEIITNKRYRAIAYLSFYAIVFIVLVAYARSIPNNPNSNSNTKIGVMTQIIEKNFDFNYKIRRGNSEKDFVGKQYLNKILFTDSSNGKQYFIKDDIVLEKSAGNYILSKNPTYLFNYLDINLIEKIFLKSKKDENDYTVLASEFTELIGYEDTNLNEDFEILIETKKTENKLLLIFNLDEYVKKVFADEGDKLKIELEYTNFGKIQDFDVN